MRTARGRRRRRPRRRGARRRRSRSSCPAGRDGQPRADAAAERDDHEPQPEQRDARTPTTVTSRRRRDPVERGRRRARSTARPSIRPGGHERVADHEHAERDEQHRERDAPPATRPARVAAAAGAKPRGVVDVGHRTLATGRADAAGRTTSRTATLTCVDVLAGLPLELAAQAVLHPRGDLGGGGRPRDGDLDLDARPVARRAATGPGGSRGRASARRSRRTPPGATPGTSRVTWRAIRVSARSAMVSVPRASATATARDAAPETSSRPSTTRPTSTPTAARTSGEHEHAEPADGGDEREQQAGEQPDGDR